VGDRWTLTEQHLDQLEQMAVPYADPAEKILVLLQQGDETWIIVRHNVIIVSHHIAP
jgi:predicted esterase YcpF (UPF0227 family)